MIAFGWIYTINVPIGHEMTYRHQVMIIEPSGKMLTDGLVFTHLGDALIAVEEWVASHPQYRLKWLVERPEEN